MMPLSERAQAILAKIERELPSRKVPRTFAEKLEFLDRLKKAADEHERACRLEATETENA